MFYRLPFTENIHLLSHIFQSISHLEELYLDVIKIKISGCFITVIKCNKNLLLYKCNKILN